MMHDLSRSGRSMRNDSRFGALTSRTLQSAMTGNTDVTVLHKSSTAFADPTGGLVPTYNTTRWHKGTYDKIRDVKSPVLTLKEKAYKDSYNMSARTNYKFDVGTKEIKAVDFPSLNSLRRQGSALINPKHVQKTMPN